MNKCKSRSRSGPNGKQQKIAAEIRKAIIRGVYKPGDKLPPRVEFENTYDCGPATVQKAFNKLKEDNSVTISRNQGTYVSKHSPCLTNYAIIFPFSIEELNQEISFYSTLANLATQYKDNDKNRFIIYTGLNGHEDEADYLRLYEDVRSESLAGIIFATSPHEICKTPLYKKIINRDYLPKVAFMDFDNKYPELSTIISIDDCLSRVFDYFEEKNIKRLAVISVLSESSQVHRKGEIIAEASKRGIELPPYHFQARSSCFAARSQELVHVMLKCIPRERPQALWITNDSLVEASTLGILDAGLKVPDDLLVISHCNFPENPKSSVDTSWYGLNVSTFIAKAITLMQSYKKTGKIDRHVIVPQEYYLK